MSNFVTIGTSVSELVTAAHRVRTRGEQLTDEMRSAIDAIDALDTDATLGNDDFARSFKHNGEGGGYHGEVDDGEGRMLAANEAVKGSARTLGEAITRVGENVAIAMGAYATTDEDNATDITDAAGA